MRYQNLVVIAGKLRNVKEAEVFFEILKDYANSIRDCRWCYFPAIKVKRRNGYGIEVVHLGCCSKSQRKKITALKAKLEKRFKVSIKYLNVEKLKEI